MALPACEDADNDCSFWELPYEPTEATGRLPRVGAVLIAAAVVTVTLVWVGFLAWLVSKTYWLL